MANKFILLCKNFPLVVSYFIRVSFLLLVLQKNSKIKRLPSLVNNLKEGLLSRSIIFQINDITLKKQDKCKKNAQFWTELGRKIKLTYSG